MKKRVYFKTFGCRTNQFDTQVMMSVLKDFEIVLNEEVADIVVVNSCTVTNGADVSTRSYINRVKREGKRVYLTGCGALSKGEELFKQGALSGVFGHSEKRRINHFLTQENFFEIGDLEYVDESIVSDFVGKSRAFIKIQEGCDFACSYCIIPSVRGRARSLDEERILAQIEKLASNGFGEFIFTGTNVGSYGKDNTRSLARFLKRVSYIRGVRRVRIGSLEPVQIDAEFKELLGEPWLEKHLHIAIQHAHDTMLKRMNRRNCVREDIALFEEIASKGFAIGTDFILAHPYETSDIWQETMQNVAHYPLTHIHAFTYSKRDNTASAKMPSLRLSKEESKGRYQELTALIAQKNLAFRKQHATTPLEVLIESKKGGIYRGHDQFFNRVSVQSDQALQNSWIEVRDYVVKKDETLALY